METSYSIIDIKGFTQSIRDGAAKSIYENYTENLNNFITLSQIEKFITDISLGTDEEGNLIITESVFDETFEYVCRIIYQVGLSKLAAANKIECAWDSENNEMVFWTNNTPGVS